MATFSPEFYQHKNIIAVDNRQLVAALIYELMNYRISFNPNWKLHIKELCKTLNQTKYAIRKALKWLHKHGYAWYVRFTNGKTRWQFSITPFPDKQAATTVIQPRVDFPHVENRAVLVINKDIEKKEQQREPEPILQEPVVVFSGENLQGTEQEPMPIPNSDPIPAPEPIPLQDPEPIPAPEPVKEPVVVFSGNEEATALVFPPELSEPQRKKAKHEIKKAPLDMQQAILLVLAVNLAKGTIKNPVGYLNKLITAANNGTFDPIDSSGGTKKDNPNLAKTDAKLSAYRDIKASSSEVWRGAMSGIRAALRGAAI